MISYDCGGESLMALGPAETLSSAPKSEVNQDLTCWFIDYLTGHSDKDALTGEDFERTINALTHWCADHFNAGERAALVETLTDPNLTFASEVAAAMVEGIVEKLLE